jgi:hypothetical protein
VFLLLKQLQPYLSAANLSTAPSASMQVQENPYAKQDSSLSEQVRDDKALADILGNINIKAESNQGLIQPNTYGDAFENQ